MQAVLDNLRSLQNVGSIFRTAEGLGVAKLYLCGTTARPHPDQPWRRDHLALAKTALGAEKLVSWEYCSDTVALVDHLKKEGLTILALETTPNATPLTHYKPRQSGEIGLVIGNEVTGINPKVIALADQVIKIPMVGQKESLNVAVAFGIAAFWLLQLAGK